MAPKIVDKEEKRTQIAHAAGQVFGDKGFDKTRMDDVAQMAGVGKGTIYEYFKTKDELIEGVFQLMMNGIAEPLMAAMAVERAPLDTLREIGRITVQAMEEMGHGYRFFLEYTLYSSRKEEEFSSLRDLLGQYRAGATALLQAAKDLGHIRQDVDVEASAAAFAAWYDGAVFHWIIFPDRPTMQEMSNAFCDAFFAGMGPIVSGGAK